MTSSEAPILLTHHAATRECTRRPPDNFGKWIPHASDRPAGPSPQAVRVFRRGEQPVTLRLLTTKTYKIGRGLGCQLLFSDATVSRLHAFCTLCPSYPRGPSATRSACWAATSIESRRRASARGSGATHPSV